MEFFIEPHIKITIAGMCVSNYKENSLGFLSLLPVKPSLGGTSLGALL